jgi:hypothetical protein
MKLGLLFRRERVENFVIKKFNRLIINNEVLEKFVTDFGLGKTAIFCYTFANMNFKSLI